ncbi:hypothetical protein G6F66_014398 [Rhizopus arrhizus]|nr:hypothetical protein G6F66_014398 [Rhizopus arrhizus]
MRLGIDFGTSNSAAAIVHEGKLLPIRFGDAEQFRKEVSALPEVIAAHLVSGESDFLLQVVVPDLRGYERFLLGTLLKLPGVKDIRSNFAIQTVKPQSPLPLDHLGK